MSDIAELTERVNRFRDEREWRPHHLPKDLAMDLSIEAAELLEHFLWKDNDEVAAYVKTKEGKEAISDELMDTLYAVLSLCFDLGVDIRAAFESKMRKNEAKYPIEKAKGSKRKYTEL